MPFKIMPSKDKIKLVWTELDGSMDASWTILSEDDEEKQLELLERACAFVRRQRGEEVRQVEEIKTFLVNDALGDVERIPMGPPVASDLPAGGPPPSMIGWAGLARASTAPPIPAASANGPMGWEYIPADEL